MDADVKGFKSPSLSTGECDCWARANARIIRDHGHQIGSLDFPLTQYCVSNARVGVRPLSHPSSKEEEGLGWDLMES